MIFLRDYLKMLHILWQISFDRYHQCIFTSGQGARGLESSSCHSAVQERLCQQYGQLPTYINLAHCLQAV